MRKKSVVLLLAGALAFTGGELGASDTPEAGPVTLRPGARLRVVVEGESAPVTGRVVSTDSEAVVLEVGHGRPALRIDWDSILAASVARRHARRGVARGILSGMALGMSLALVAGEGDTGDALGGAFAGAVLALPTSAAGAAAARGRGALVTGALAGAVTGGVLFAAIGSSCSQGDWVCAEPGELAAAGAYWGALSGAAAAWAARERWEPIEARRFRVALGPAPRGGVGAAVQIRF
jgi:hypothetical protein